VEYPEGTARERRSERSFNGEKVFAVEDATLAGAGRVGVWTKADPVTRFDDLDTTIVKQEEP